MLCFIHVLWLIFSLNEIRVFLMHVVICKQWSMDFIFFTFQDHVFYSYLVAFSQLILLMIILISLSFIHFNSDTIFKTLAANLSFLPHCLFYNWFWYKEFEKCNDSCMKIRIETLVLNGANYSNLQIGGKLLKGKFWLRFIRTVCYNVLQYILVCQFLIMTMIRKIEACL